MLTKIVSKENKLLFSIHVILALIFLGAEFGRTGDFYIYYSAASKLFTAPDIYHLLYGKEPLFFYFGNPFLTFLIYPLTYLPIQIATLLFKASCLFMLFRTWKLIENYFDTKNLNGTQKIYWISGSFLVMLFPIYKNFHLVQFTFILLYCILEGIYQIRIKDRKLLGSSILTLAIFTKLTPIVIIPYLLYRKQTKAVSYILLISILFFFLPSICLGLEKNYFLWNKWFTLIKPNDSNVFDMNNVTNHGLSTLLATLFIKGIPDNVPNLTIRRHLIDLAPQIVVYIIQITRLLLTVFMLYFLRSLPFKKQSTPLHSIWEISYLLLVIPLIFPQQRSYNFLLLFPAVSYILFYFINSSTKEKNFKNLTFYLFTFGAILLNLELLLGLYRKYFWHYKTLTYAALIILILLAFLNPKKLSQSQATNKTSGN